MGNTPGNESSPDREARIRDEQTRQLYAATPVVVWGSLLGAAVVAAAFWNVTDLGRLLVWCALLLLVTLVRALQGREFERRRPDVQESRPWALRFWIGSAASGAVWGGAALWLLPEDPAYQVLLAFVIGAAGAVAVSNLSAQRIPIMTFLTLSLAPLSLRLMATESEVSRMIGFMTPIYYALMGISALRVYRTTRENICLHLETLERAQALRDSQRRLALHMQRTPLAVIDWNTRFEVTGWNAAVERMFGYTAEEAIGQRATDLIVANSVRGQVEDVWAALVGGTGGLHSINENRTKDGRTILCEWFNTTLVDESGRVIGVASLSRDITERVRMERIKNEFVSVVSHELRTPLTSIRGSLGLLLGNAVGELAPQSRELLTIADKNTQRLLRIINDILDIEKIESGKLDYALREVEVMPLIEQAISANTGYAQQYGVRFSVTDRAEGAWVRADYDRIMQVLNNLMSNAVKHAPAGSTVELGAKCFEGYVRIAVTDYGPGIPAEAQARVFERFTQLDTSDHRARGGTGLGLSIAKGIVEDHHGRIGLESGEGVGSRFYFDLPRHHPEGVAIHTGVG